jgi:hypothetical protein
MRKNFPKSPSAQIKPSTLQEKKLPTRFDSFAILETMPNYVIKTLNNEVI